MSQFHSLKVNEINKETDDSVSVSFDVPVNLKDDFKYIPGQYLTLKINISGEDCRRSYSICSSFEEPLTVAVKKVLNGKMSSYINDTLKIGDSIEVMPPQGTFTLNTNLSASRKFVGFAAGSGCGFQPCDRLPSGEGLAPSKLSRRGHFRLVRRRKGFDCWYWTWVPSNNKPAAQNDGVNPHNPLCCQ